MPSWLTGDTAQTLLAFLALFTGGYGGARYGSIARLRTDVRQRVWLTLTNELSSIGREVNDIETLVEAAMGAHERFIAGHRESETKLGQFGPLVPAKAAAISSAVSDISTTIERVQALVAPIQADIELLTWTERISFHQAFDGLVVRLAELFDNVIMDFELAQNPSSMFFVPIEELRFDEALSTCRISEEDLTSSVGRFRDHLHRRLRPGWWRRPRDWNHSVKLLWSQLNSG